MGKLNWDPKLWMMSCIGPNWSYFLSLCWWVKPIYLFIYFFSITASDCTIRYSALCGCVYCSRTKTRVIPLDYLHAFPAAALSCNPWGPGSKGLNLSQSMLLHNSKVYLLTIEATCVWAINEQIPHFGRGLRRWQMQWKHLSLSNVRRICFLCLACRCGPYQSNVLQH